MTEEKFGLKIEYLPNKVKVGAISQEGLRGLNEWMGNSKDGRQLRVKLQIDESEWPILRYEQLQDGKIFRVIFEN